MSVKLALYQTDIANNTGTLIRLCACLDTTIHIIYPTGFAFSAKTLARARLDYLDRAAVRKHDSWTGFDQWRRAENRRLILLTTKARTSAYAAICAHKYRDDGPRERGCTRLCGRSGRSGFAPSNACWVTLDQCRARRHACPGSEAKRQIDELQGFNNGSFHGHHDTSQRY